MKITAAVLHQCGGHQRPYGAGAPLRLHALELDPPKPGELLVRIDAAGLCHSDLSVINGDRPRPMPMAARRARRFNWCGASGRSVAMTTMIEPRSLSWLCGVLS